MPVIPLWHKTDCTFSDDRLYRYTLTRHFPSGHGTVAFVMLNPSTADESRDDPTVRRCVGYAHAWGFAKLEVLNIFAFRSTDPTALRSVDDPVGPANDEHIVRRLRGVDQVVCAWGADRMAADRQPQVLRLIKAARKQAMCLKRTGDGSPCHPLYLKATLKPVRLT